MLPGFTATSALDESHRPTRAYAARSRSSRPGRTAVDGYLLPQVRIMDETGSALAPDRTGSGGLDAQQCTCPCCIKVNGMLRCC